MDVHHAADVLFGLPSVPNDLLRAEDQRPSRTDTIRRSAPRGGGGGGLMRLAGKLAGMRTHPLRFPCIVRVLAGAPNAPV